MREELNGALRVRLREKLGEREVFGLDCNPWSRLGEKAQWGGGQTDSMTRTHTLTYPERCDCHRLTLLHHDKMSPAETGCITAEEGWCSL